MQSINGMIIAQDIRTHMGTLIVSRGFEVTQLFLDRSRNFGQEILDEVINVVVPPAQAVEKSGT